MAKNWKLSEAVVTIAKGEDVEARIDIGRRFPLLITASPFEILSVLDTISARKVEKLLRAKLLGEDSADDDDDVPEDEPEVIEPKVVEKAPKKVRAAKAAPVVESEPVPAPVPAPKRAKKAGRKAITSMVGDDESDEILESMFEE